MESYSVSILKVFVTFVDITAGGHRASHDQTMAEFRAARCWWDPECKTKDDGHVAWTDDAPVNVFVLTQS